MATDFKNRQSPGVFVTELDSFPPSVIGVDTGVPAFIGFTEKNEMYGKSVHLKPIRIDSLASFEQIFGGPPVVPFSVQPDGSAENFDFELKNADGTTSYYLIRVAEGAKEYLLFNSLRLFYANGGGDCFVVSVGTYGDSVSSGALREGIDALGDQLGPTMLVAPEAVLLARAEFAMVAVSMLAQCGKMQDRMSLLDVCGSETMTGDNVGPAIEKLAEKFQKSVGNENLSYGAAYFPFLNTSVVPPSEVTHANFDAKGLKAALSAFAAVKYAEAPNQLAQINTDLLAKIGKELDPEEADTVDRGLLNALFPLVGQIYSETAKKLGVLPSSGAMAGLYAKNDQLRGVQNAPANYHLNAVISPTVNLNDEQSGSLNQPLNGKSINPIREFVGRGTVVWGARTLDGNSGDWRYIQVRRTIIYLEQSIRQALDPLVFAANEGKTWATVTSMISNFLQGFWAQGGLMGASASEAFSVECGLGSTMTPQDILEGHMIVQVRLQIVRPAEFIVLTFQQKMAEG